MAAWKASSFQDKIHNASSFVIYNIFLSLSASNHISYYFREIQLLKRLKHKHIINLSDLLENEEKQKMYPFTCAL